MAKFAVLGKIGSVDLEIRAGQIVEQHAEGSIEQIAPALGQMLEQSLFVSEQQIVAGVEFVSRREAEVGAEQVGHALSRNHWRCSRHSLPGAMSR